MKPLLAIAILVAAAVACDGSSGGADGGVGAACGGRAGAACPADQYCDFSNNSCGTDDGAGRCAPRPASCPALLVAERTCGCDQRVYSSACEALLSGTDLNQAGTCSVDPGAFVCGYRQCSLTNEHCQRTGSDVGGEPDGFTCRGLPSGCGAQPGCACLAGQACGNSCSGDAARGLTLVCPGG